jgi:hypothetical protein
MNPDQPYKQDMVNRVKPNPYAALAETMADLVAAFEQELFTHEEAVSLARSILVSQMTANQNKSFADSLLGR